MRLIAAATILLPVLALADVPYMPPILPSTNLPLLCSQMEHAAEWLAAHPDDVDEFLERFLENGNAIEAHLADIAVRQSVGANDDGFIASVERECIRLMRRVSA